MDSKNQAAYETEAAREAFEQWWAEKFRSSDESLAGVKLFAAEAFGEGFVEGFKRGASYARKLALDTIRKASE
jgi:flagellar biosynthesis/type III secretory pathway protein FliH